jgi:cell division protein FtsB
MRLSNDLAESNMWREKLSDKINERDAELATLAQTANELRAENERLRGKGEPSK